MKKEIVWLMVTGLIALSLLAASCAPKVEEAAPAAPTVPAAPTAPTVPAAPAAPAKERVKLTLTKLDGTKMEKLVEKPRYGGTLRYFITAPFRGLDPWLSAIGNVEAGRLYTDSLGGGDWTRSSAGTGETNFHPLVYYPPAFMVGELAESWEVPDSNTIIYHLRKGVKFQDKTPTGSWSGREMTSDDVVFSIKQVYALKISTAYTSLSPQFHPVSLEATDKYTVVVKSAPGSHILQTHEVLNPALPVLPRDFIEKYKNMTDWRNVIGTGAFILVDYVPASVATFNRNPNYWKKDPLFPENQLPYVDKVEWFIIPDKSTYLAALRTGKVDRGILLSIEDLEGLLKTRPDMPYSTGLVNLNSQPLGLTMNNPDGTPKPAGWVFNDVRVRRALSMAIDRESIIKNFFRGYAELFSWPVANVKEFVATGLYVPLEQQPALVREIFSYNPEKAKQLLAEAGYPKGFKTSVDITVENADYVSIIKEYFAAIGVDMEIKVRSDAVWAAMERARTFEQMNYGGGGNAGAPYQFNATRWPPGRMNRNNVNDPYINELSFEILNLVYDEPAQRKLFKEKAYAYLLEQVYNIVVPLPYDFRVRQPWLRNNDAGELHVGTFKTDSWPLYVWIDQELKKAMGY